MHHRILTLILALILAAPGFGSAIINKSWARYLKCKNDTCWFIRADKSESLAVYYNTSRCSWCLVGDSISIISDSSIASEGEVEDSLDQYVTTPVDSGKTTNDGLSLDDINWRYEWGYLNIVHGFNRKLSDSIDLSFPVQSLNSDTVWLLTDSAGNITANDQDTVTISGFINYACTIDSLEIMYRVTSGSRIDSLAFRGPDRSIHTNLCDSLYWGSGADHTATTWTIQGYTFTYDVTAMAGDQFAMKYIANFAADNNRLHIGWIRVRIRR